MKNIWADLAHALGDNLPTIMAYLPIPAVASGILSAMGKALLNNVQATPEEVKAKVAEDPALAQKVLQPLEDHLQTVAQATTTGASTVTPAELPKATIAVVDAVNFATDDRTFTMSPTDADGGATLSMYLEKAELASLKRVIVA